MGKAKSERDYQAVSVPTKLLKDIKLYLKHSNYTSIAEFVKEAVRDKLKEKCPHCGKFLH